MSAMRHVLAEMAGLFIDDARLALLEVLLIATVAASVKMAVLQPLWGAILLLLGCLAILTESVFRARH